MKFPAPEYITEFECSVFVEPRSKGSDHISVPMRDGRSRIIANDDYKYAKKEAIAQLRALAGGQRFHPQSALGVNMLLGYTNPRRDTDGEMVCDALEKAGIIDNDVQIEEKHIYRHREYDRGFFKVRVVDLGYTLPWRRTRKGKVLA